MLKHTPKPWSIDPNDKDGCFVTADCDGLRVADCYNGERQLDDECAANAKLISAAPELLEAIKEICCAADEGNAVTLIKARAALAKATT